MKKIFLLCVICVFSVAIFCEEKISYSGKSNYSLVERTNLREYVNGKYTGLLSKEVRSFIIKDKETKSGVHFSGNFFVEQDTVRNQKVVYNGIHEAISAGFYISETGALSMTDDNGYPTFRSFPVFPQKKVNIGESWKGESVRAVDPLNNGKITKIPMTVLYQLVGEEDYKGEKVYRINAEWATRYGISYWDWGGDKDLNSAQGSHKAYVLVSKKSGLAVFMSDTVDEIFTYNDGTTIAFKGTILQFTEYPASVEHEEIIPALKRIGAVVAKADDTFSGENEIKEVKKEIKSDNSKKSNETKKSEEKQKVEPKPSVSKKAEQSGKKEENPVQTKKSGDKNKKPETTKKSEVVKKSEESKDAKITVTETDAGIKLAIHDLKFKADSDELLAGEEKRLDEIAGILKMASSSMFLVEGHTADTGYAEGELKLSKQRAYKIAEELAKRGIDAGRFICKGAGATKPIADNSTSEGKAKNRRVEITILEK